MKHSAGSNHILSKQRHNAGILLATSSPSSDTRASDDACVSYSHTACDWRLVVASGVQNLTTPIGSL